MQFLRLCAYCTALFAVLHAGAVPVRVLTFNIHHAEGDDGKVDLDRIAQVVLSTKADVVCLQEVDRNLPRTAHLDFPALLSEKLGMKAYFEANYRFDGGEYGNAIFTNLPVEALKNHALPNPPGLEPRGCLELKVKVGAGALTILNTHLGLRREERAAQVEAVLKFLPPERAFFAGDLNEVPTGPPVQALLVPLRDSFVAAASGPDKTYSTTVLDRRIDYILSTPDIQVTHARILNDPEAAAASDHLPYLVDLELP